MKQRTILLLTAALPAVLAAALLLTPALPWGAVLSSQTLLAAAPAQAPPAAGRQYVARHRRPRRAQSARGREAAAREVKLPAGFSIALWADNVKGARTMTLAPDGTVFVGTWTIGNVYALADRNKDNRADAVITIASGLTMPNGVAFKDGTLYVAEINRIVRFDRVLEPSNPAWRRSPRPSSSTSCRPTACTAGNICASGLTAISTPRSARPATSATSPSPTPASCGSSPTAPASRCSRAASATPSASPGTPIPASSGSPTTAATCSATSSQTTS